MVFSNLSISSTCNRVHHRNQILTVLHKCRYQILTVLHKCRYTALVAATRRGDRSLHLFRSDDQLQQHVAATRRSDKSLRVCWRIFVKIFLSATEFCRCNKSQKIKSDCICATCCGDKDFHKNSPLHTERFAAATCRLVCSDLNDI